MKLFLDLTILFILTIQCHSQSTRFTDCGKFEFFIIILSFLNSIFDYIYMRDLKTKINVFNFLVMRMQFLKQTY